MPKNSTIFVCAECGATSPRWLGRCPSCGKFNTMAEEVVKDSKPAAAGGGGGGGGGRRPPPPPGGGGGGGV